MTQEDLLTLLQADLNILQPDATRTAQLTQLINAALQLIAKLVDQGYQLVTVSEMAQARGINMKAGETYTDFNK